MKEHIRWIDVARCFGIFAIYLGHLQDQAGAAYEFVYTYHVPLFFLISGCMECFAKDTCVIERVKKVLKTIVVPWLFFALIAVAFHVVRKDAGLGEVARQLKEIALGTICDRFISYSLWFLTGLALMKLLFVLLRKIKFKPLIILICLILFIIEAKHELPKYYNFHRVFRFSIYYAVGYTTFPFICRALEPKSQRGKIALVASAVCAFIYAVCVFFGINPLFWWPPIRYIKYLSPIVTALVLIWLNLVVAKLCENINLFVNVGKNTLYMCGTEYLIRKLLEESVSIVGLHVAIGSPMAAYIYSVALLAIVNRYFVPLEKRLLGFIYSLPHRLKNEKKPA